MPHRTSVQFLDNNSPDSELLQLFFLQYFACNPFVVITCEGFPVIPMKTRNFRGGGGGTPYPLIVLVVSSQVTTDLRKYAALAMWQAAAA